MKSPEKRNNGKTICMVWLLSVIIGLFILFLRENMEKNIDFKSVNEYGQPGEWSQGNYVLFRKPNGLHTYPILWGKGLYLYSVQEDQEYLIKTLKLPFQKFSKYNLAIQGDRIQYNYLWSDSYFDYLWNPGIYLKNLRAPDLYLNGQKEHIIMDADKLYYVKQKNKGNVLKSGLYSSKIDGTKEKYITEISGFPYLRAEDGRIFLCDYDYPERLMEIETETNLVNPYKWQGNEDENIEWIGNKDKNHLIILTTPSVYGIDIKSYEKVYEYNKKTEMVKKIAQISDLEFDEDCNHIKYKESFFYYKNWDNEICRVDITNGKKEKIIALTDIPELEDGIKKGNSFEVNVNYCTDYIILEAEDEEKETKNLLVYNYEGELLRNVNISGIRIFKRKICL